MSTDGQFLKNQIFNVVARFQPLRFFQIRKLLCQCSDRDQELNQAREEIEKLTSKINSLSKEKIQLESHVATLEKSIAAVQKRMADIENTVTLVGVNFFF